MVEVWCRQNVLCCPIIKEHEDIPDEKIIIKSNLQPPKPGQDRKPRQNHNRPCENCTCQAVSKFKENAKGNIRMCVVNCYCIGIVDDGYGFYNDRSTGWRSRD
jgi:hypothetical protein